MQTKKQALATLLCIKFPGGGQPLSTLYFVGFQSWAWPKRPEPPLESKSLIDPGTNRQSMSSIYYPVMTCTLLPTFLDDPASYLDLLAGLYHLRQDLYQQLTSRVETKFSTYVLFIESLEMMSRNVEYIHPLSQHGLPSFDRFRARSLALEPLVLDPAESRRIKAISTAQDHRFDIAPILRC